jgi:hypothetical protein
MPDLHSLPAGWLPERAVRNNGPNNLALERWKLRELAEGWPMYRDTCEWENLESIFAPNCYIYTTWSGYDFVDPNAFMNFADCLKKDAVQGLYRSFEERHGSRSLHNASM